MVPIRRHVPLTSVADNRLQRSIQLLLARRLESQLADKPHSCGSFLSDV